MKKHIFFLIGVVAVLSSCSTAYKSAQTPDDVYYSPGSPKVATARSTDDNGNADDRYDDYISSNDDQYLRMKVRNRNTWSTIDDYDYWYDSRYDFGYGCSISRSSMFYSFNPYYYRPWTTNFYAGSSYGLGLCWGSSYYNPYAYGGYYYPGYTVVTYKNPKISLARNTSYLNSYKTKTYSNSNYNTRNLFRNYNYNNSNNRTYNNGNSTYRYNNSNSNSSSSSRTFSSGGSSRSSSGGGGSSAPRSSGGGGRPPR